MYRNYVGKEMDSRLRGNDGEDPRLLGDDILRQNQEDSNSSEVKEGVVQSHPAFGNSLAWKGLFGGDNEEKVLFISLGVTVGKNLLKPDEIWEEDLNYIERALTSDEIKDKVQKLRKLATKEEQNSFKRKLPWFNLGRFSGRRSNQNWLGSTGCVLDYDNLEQRPHYYKTKVLPQLNFVYMAFTSPRGKGLKVIVLWHRFVTNEAEHRALYNYVKKMYDRALGMESDSTPDPARVTFLSYDEDFYINLIADKLPVDKVLSFQKSVELIRLRNRMLSSKSTEKIPASAGMTNSEQAEDDFEKAQDDSRTRLSVPQVLRQAEDFEKARQVVNGLAQIRFDYKDFIKVGLALSAGFGERGRELWDILLSNPNYSDTQRQFDTYWRSFHSVRNVTLASLFYIGEKYGIRYN